VVYMRLGSLILKRTEDSARYAFTSLAVMFDVGWSSDASSFAGVAWFGSVEPLKGHTEWF